MVEGRLLCKTGEKRGRWYTVEGGGVGRMGRGWIKYQDLKRGGYKYCKYFKIQCLYIFIFNIYIYVFNNSIYIYIYWFQFCNISTCSPSN